MFAHVPDAVIDHAAVEQIGGDRALCFLADDRLRDQQHHEEAKPEQQAVLDGKPRAQFRENDTGPGYHRVVKLSLSPSGPIVTARAMVLSGAWIAGSHTRSTAAPAGTSAKVTCPAASVSAV